MCLVNFYLHVYIQVLALNWLVGMELWAGESRLDNYTLVMWEALVKYYIGANFVQRWGHMVVIHAVVKNLSKLGHGSPIVSILFKPYYLKSKTIKTITMYALLFYKICVNPTFL